MKISKKQRAFELFSQGYLPSSPEVKELNLKGNTRYTYYDIWKRQDHSLGSSAPQLSSDSKKTTGKTTPLPGRESLSSIDETKFAKRPDVEAEQPAVEAAAASVEEELAEDPEDIEEEPPEEEQGEIEEQSEETEEAEAEVEEKEDQKDALAKPGISPVDVSKIRKDGKKGIPRDIIGQGITVTVELSIKTLALYQIAANMQEDELTLGDFLDTCAEDEYRVRGKDLGLIQLGRE